MDDRQARLEEARQRALIITEHIRAPGRRGDPAGYPEL